VSKASWTNVGGVDLVGAATITAATNRLAITGHGLADGDLITVDTGSGGGAELRADTEYVARNPTTNDFQVSTPAGAAVFDFTADGTCTVYRAVPEYASVDLRRFDAITLHPGTPDPAGAREGVRPHAIAPIALTGATYTVNGGLAVVYPRETSTSGPYRVYYDAASAASFNPADGSNDRLDGIDLQVQDDDEDGQGQRRVRIVYVPGTPAGSPTEPALTDSSLRLALVRIHAGGSPAPTIERLAPYALGAGILPLRNSTEYPTNPYEGMVVFRQDTGALEVYFGGAWTGLAGAGGYQYLTTVAYDSSGTFTKASYPGLRAVKFRCQGGGGAGGGAAAAGSGSATGGGGGQGGNYAEKFVLASALASSVTITRGAGGTGVTGAAGGDGGTSSAGTHCVAGGGTGGSINSSTTLITFAISGTPNTTGTGDLVIPGSAGGFATLYGAGDAACSGAGGNSNWGAGSRPVNPAAGADGTAGALYGGGGSGAANTNSQGSTRIGGAGAAGRVLVDLYI
jgi:hypothetical protein